MITSKIILLQKKYVELDIIHNMFTEILDRLENYSFNRPTHQYTGVSIELIELVYRKVNVTKLINTEIGENIPMDVTEEKICVTSLINKILSQIENDMNNISREVTKELKSK